MADGNASENGEASRGEKCADPVGTRGALFVFVEPSAHCRSLIRKAELSNGPAICLKMLDGTRRAQVVN